MLNYYAITIQTNGETHSVFCEAPNPSSVARQIEQQYREAQYHIVEIKKMTNYENMKLPPERWDPEKQSVKQTRTKPKREPAAKDHRKKIVVTPKGEFPSVFAAWQHYGSAKKLRELIRKDPENFYFKKQ